MSTNSKQYAENGFTLIELMISMALGLVISLAAVQLFTTGLSSYNLQRGVGDVNENGRFALDFMARSIRQFQPGEGDRDRVNLIVPVVFQVTDIPGGTLPVISQNNQTALGVGSSDQLVVQTLVNASMPNYRDCEGNNVAAGNVSVARYFIRADVPSGSPAALACDAGTYDNNLRLVTNNYGDAGVVLLSSVDSFQVLYGIGPTPAPPSGLALPVRYVTSNALLPGDIVVAIRIGMLVRSLEGVGNFTAPPLATRVLDVPLTSAALQAAGNNSIRRVFTSTIALRNNM